MCTFFQVDSSVNVKCLARVACEKSFLLKLKALEEKYYNWEDAASFLKPVVKKVKKKKKGKGSETISSEGVSNVEDELSNSRSEDDGSGDEIGSEINEDSNDGKPDSCPLSPDNLQTHKDISTATTVPTRKLNAEIKVKQKNNNKNKSKETKAKLPAKKVEVKAKAPGISVVRKIRNLEDLEQFESIRNDPSCANVGEARKDSFFLSADGEEVESEVEEGNSSEAQESEDEWNQGPNKVYHSRGREEGYEHRRTFGALNNQESQGKQTQKFKQKQPQLKRFVLSILPYKYCQVAEKGHSLSDFATSKKTEAKKTKRHNSCDNLIG